MDLNLAKEAEGAGRCEEINQSSSRKEDKRKDLVLLGVAASRVLERF